MVQTMAVLGHVVAASASAWPCYEAAEDAAWRAFWRGAGGRAGRALSLRRRLAALEREVRPILGFRWACWPWALALAHGLQRLQRAMIAGCLHLPRDEGEAPEIAPPPHQINVGVCKKVEGKQSKIDLNVTPADNFVWDGGGEEESSEVNTFFRTGLKVVAI